MEGVIDGDEIEEVAVQLSLGGLQYVAGYITRKLGTELNLAEEIPDDATRLGLQNKGGLIIAEDRVEQWKIQIDQQFNVYHPQDLVTGKNIINRTVTFIAAQLSELKIPIKIISLFVNRISNSKSSLETQRTLLNLK